jgi:uncharacterized protein (DUF1501 family)
MLPIGNNGFAFSNGDGAVHRRLIVLLLRGAVDGLSVVVPYREQNYYAKRHSIALQPPGSTEGVVDLDGFFGLHPALAPMMPLWQNRSLAFVHACGYPSNLRSHFEAQDIIETASMHSAPRGWMNTLLTVLPDTHSSTRALSMSKEMPKIFTGGNNVALVPPGINADAKPTFQNPKVEGEFTSLYASNPALSGLFKEAVTSRDQMIDDLHKEMIAAGGNAPYPDGFPGQTVRLASMIKQDPSIELAFMELGGWDTHVNQGNAKGQLADRLGKLGEGLATLSTSLGNHYQETTIMVLSEFGRTVAENGNNGTDHGHGNAIWLLGGNIAGGQVHGRWPGIADNQLFEGRDLAATTDFRSVIGTVLAGQFGLDNGRIAKAIPDYQPDSGLRLFMYS